MSQFSWNLIEVNVVIVLLFLGYLAIRNRLSFVQQRATIISLPFVAITTILVKSGIDFSSISYSLQVVELETIQIGGELAASNLQAASTIISLNQLYWIGVAVFGALFLFRITKIILFFLKNDSIKTGRYQIYKVSDKASFSFFNRIQITSELNSDEQEIVLEHEKVHVNKLHSIDTVLAELFHVFLWFNPVFFFMKREMVNLHEYEVDALMYKKHKVNYMKFLVNYALGSGGSNYLLTSRFYNRLTLKKRIKIMKTNIRKKTWLLSVIPLIGISAIMLQCVKTDDVESERETPEVVENEQPEAVYDMVEVDPMYTGGQEAMQNYIIENVTYPQIAKDNNIQGTVYVSFIVSKTGEVIKPMIRAGDDESLNAEALRVVSGMPNWIPGEVKGEKVAVNFTLPISFKLG
ncbi:MAG: TonB family protein [Crocinitomix sp.]|nr:TonB family protein [Crocinitomix sp.]